MSTITPGDAQAFKIKLQPSVAFNQSYSRSYRPRPVVQRQYVYSAPYVQSYYDPYYPVEYRYYYPAQTYEYVDYYYYPSRRYVRSSGTDFQMKFKIK
ncbi:MAG: hypothetical protein ACE5GN_05730 [Waddliaceae bacterium]